jgi:hypothetical protein
MKYLPCEEKKNGKKEELKGRRKKSMQKYRKN